MASHNIGIINNVVIPDGASNQPNDQGVTVPATGLIEAVLDIDCTNMPTGNSFTYMRQWQYSDNSWHDSEGGFVSPPFTDINGNTTLHFITICPIPQGTLYPQAGRLSITNAVSPAGVTKLSASITAS